MRCFICMDIMISRHRPLNISMCSGKKSEQSPSRELYKFFDREGNTLVLRPDITPSIARAAATLYEQETMPIRLCYMGNTFINHSSYLGRLKENTQMGAELLGVDSVEADVEMIAMMIDGLKKTRTGRVSGQHRSCRFHSGSVG